MKKLCICRFWVSIIIVFLSAPGDCFANSEIPKTLKYTIYEASIGTTEDGTLDPLRTFQMLYFNLQHQIFETLIGVDFNTQTVVPVLAERWEQKDALTTRFHLRRGVRFHNAEPFTAETVRFTLDLMRDPRNKFGGRFLLESIAAVQIIDDYTVDIILATPDALLLRKLAAIGFMLPPKYYSKVGDVYFTRYPMGTGPFRFFYNARNKDGIKEIHLTANEDYWGPRPAVRELVYDFIPREAQGQALRNGAVDLVVSQDASFMDEVRSDTNLTIFSQSSLRSTICLLNIDKSGPLQDIRVRRALQHCINRKDMIAVALHGRGKPLYTIAPAGSLAFDNGKPLYDENIAHARTLLSEAGYAQGFSLKAMAADNAPSRAIAQLLRTQLAHAGISLAVDFLSRDSIKKEIVEPKLMGNARPSTYDLWIINGWPDLFGASAHFYFLFLHSHGIFNFGIYLNKQSLFDSQYARILSSGNDKALIRNLRGFDRLAMQEAVVIPLYQVELVYGMNKNVRFRPGLNDLPLRFKDCVFE